MRKVKYSFKVNVSTGILCVSSSKTSVLTNYKKSFFLLHDTAGFEFQSHLNDQPRTNLIVTFTPVRTLNSLNEGLCFIFQNTTMQRCYMPFHCTFIAKWFGTEFTFKFSSGMHQTVST